MTETAPHRAEKARVGRLRAELGRAVAAGIAVVAGDTGRVLLLQRSIADTDDPAAGMWEFPGGCLEEGEAEWDGARREWQEEVGLALPEGRTAGTWLSPNGIYMGFVYVIEHEAEVPINADPENRPVGNPDDPDGDGCETTAWWDPADLPKMPALRPEVKDTDWKLIQRAALRFPAVAARPEPRTETTMTALEQSISVEGPRSVFVAGLCHLVETDKEVAWEAARHHIRVRDDIAWLMSNFISTDPAGNRNGHIFDLAQTTESHKTVVNTPLNMGHRAHDIVGTTVASELVYPTAAAAVVQVHPFVETLDAFWRGVFPDTFAAVKEAQQAGNLFLSMEAIPKSLTCKAVPDCLTVAYDGLQSDTYCDHLNTMGSPKILNQPTFVGTGVIKPPQEPGWRHADVTHIDALIRQHAAAAERVMAQLEATAPHLGEAVWVQIMATLVESALGAPVEPKPKARLPRPAPLLPVPAPVKRPVAELLFASTWAEIYGASRPAWDDVSPEDRNRWAHSGVGLPDGSYPIPDVDFLHRAIEDYGRSDPADRARVRAHIIARARALGHAELIPKGWVSSAAAARAVGERRGLASGRGAAWAEAFGEPSAPADDPEFSPEEISQLIAAGHSLPDGSHPIPDLSHLNKELRDYPTLSPAEQARVKPHIAGRAADMGYAELLPAGWTTTGAGGMTEAYATAAAHPAMSGSHRHSHLSYSPAGAVTHSHTHSHHNDFIHGHGHNGPDGPGLDADGDYDGDTAPDGPGQ